MIFDIAILILILIFAINGFRKGFVYTLITSVGWIAALTGAVFGVMYLNDFLKSHGILYDRLTEIFKVRFSAETDTLTPAVNSMPKPIGGVLDSMIDGVSDTVASGFAGVCYTAILFAAFFIVIKIFMWLVLRVFSKKFNDGFTGFFDGIFGTIFGILKGAVFICVLMLILMPVVNMISPDLTEQFALQMDQSIIAKMIYDNNPVSILIQTFYGLS